MYASNIYRVAKLLGTLNRISITHRITKTLCMYCTYVIKNFACWRSKQTRYEYTHTRYGVVSRLFNFLDRWLYSRKSLSVSTFRIYSINKLAWTVFVNGVSFKLVCRNEIFCQLFYIDGGWYNILFPFFSNWIQWNLESNDRFHLRCFVSRVLLSFQRVIEKLFIYRLV